MLRGARYKYLYHVGAPSQLFDLSADPGECKDLAASPDHGELIAQFERQLRTLLDPEETDARARKSQWEKVEASGGKEAVLRRGTFDNSPVPGEMPAFQKVQ